MDQVDRTSKLPLYHQLYEILHSNIISGQWKPGDMIPPESELVDFYAVSRTTVRQVLDKLVNDGLILRERGRGSFVTRPTLYQGLSRIVSFTEDMRRRGLEPGTRVLTSEIVQAPVEIAHSLEIETGTELAHLRRLRLANEEPMSIEDSYLVHAHCKGILENDYAHTPLRETLEHQYDIRLARAQQSIRAIGAPRDVAVLLLVKPGAPLLSMERISFSSQDVPVEFLRLFHRGDRYALYNELLG
jgi:GntR family transcriptional regulator